MSDLISRDAVLKVLHNSRSIRTKHDGARGVWIDLLDVTDGILRIAIEEPVPAAKINGSTSDGYHTFDELYHHRAVLFSVIVKAYPDSAWKSKRHHDGTMYDGMFIVGINTPWGQATYHYDIDPYWDIFECRELECAPKWDGHSPDEAIDRIGKLLPLRHGHWIQAGHDSWSSYIRCSKCKRYLRDIHPSDYKFCPYCGAKMDGGATGNENRDH